MQRFELNPAISGCRDYKRIVRAYNRLVRTLVAFEILWYQAWCQAIDKAKAGLSATLIVRHPDDENLYVNFDQDVFQLVREAKCLERMHLLGEEALRGRGREQNHKCGLEQQRQPSGGRH